MLETASATNQSLSPLTSDICGSLPTRIPQNGRLLLMKDTGERSPRWEFARRSGRVLWTFCAIDAETKLVPAFRVDTNRSLQTTKAFMQDVASRMRNRVQVSTDSLRAYRTL